MTVRHNAVMGPCCGVQLISVDDATVGLESPAISLTSSRCHTTSRCYANPVMSVRSPHRNGTDSAFAITALKRSRLVSLGRQLADGFGDSSIELDRVGCQGHLVECAAEQQVELDSGSEGIGVGSRRLSCEVVAIRSEIGGTSLARAFGAGSVSSGLVLPGLVSQAKAPMSRAMANTTAGVGFAPLRTTSLVNQTAESSSRSIEWVIWRCSA